MAGSTTYSYILDLKARTGSYTRNVKAAANHTKKAKDNIGKAQKATAGLKNSFQGIAAAAGIAFGAQQIVSFTKDLIKLSGEAEGVRTAFDRISKAGTMKELQAATKGTVSELELMKRAVSAQNLGLPVENLASLFEFATKRAQDTGESVDYLVNSIVTGIGRKSPLILDNLGITAVQLREKLKGVGMETASVADVAAAVGEIAADSMRESGKVMDTNATKVANLKTQWEDFKLSLAENKGFNKAVNKQLSTLQKMMAVWFSDQATLQEKLEVGSNKWATSIIYSNVKAREAQREEIEKVNKQYEEMYANARRGAEQTKTTTEAAQKQVTTYGDLIQQISDKNGLLKKADITDTAYIKTLYSEIAALEKKKEAFENLAKPMQKAVERAAAPAMMQTTGFDSSALGGITPDSKSLGNMEAWKQSQQQYLDELKKNWWDYAENVQMVSDAVQRGFESMGHGIVDSLGLADEGFEGFLKGLAETAMQLVSMMLAQSIAASINNATMSATATGPAAVFTQPAFMATLIGGVMSAFAAIPKFADGGLAYGATMGMVGEYPGAKNNPEVIAPLSKLKGMLNNGNVQVKLSPAVEFDGRKLRVGLKEVDYIEGRLR